MTRFLLALFLFQVGFPQPAGVVSGIVRGSDGKALEGTRVFAVAFRDAAEAATGATIFEALAQTDASGRYRLEVPPGRYYIASGAVSSPTYYPGTTKLSDARLVTVASGAQVNAVDIAGFVAPPPPPLSSGIVLNIPLILGSTLSLDLPNTVYGTIRLQDGTPVQRMEVRAVSVVVQPPPRQPEAVLGRTDNQGRYRLESIRPGNYYIVAGTGAPTYYPGVPDVASATVITVSMSGPGNTRKDFTIPGVAIIGRVAGASGLSISGARIRVRTAFNTVIWDETADETDGSYWIGGLVPGTYVVEASIQQAPPQSKEVTIGTASLKGIDFSLPIAIVSGRISLEDGSAIADTRALGVVEFSRTDNPNSAVSDLLVSSSATFRSVMAPGQYKIEMPSLTAPYRIKSIMAGLHDLLKEPLKVTTTESVSIEIRLAK